MREVADKRRIDRFMQALGEAARRDIRVYWVGGTTAVRLGWRATTIDVDLVMQPEDETLLRAIGRLKESLHLASVLYEMLTGEPPHMGNSAQQVIMKIIAEPAPAVIATLTS